MNHNDPQGGHDSLAAALADSHISLDEQKTELLDRYCRALWEWNEKINLTRHTTYEKFVERDLVDALALAEQLAKKERVLDVGSGGGVPGVVLAILRPDLKISLCESVGKKARVLSEIVQRLGLQTPVRHARAEDLLKTEKYDVLVIRAVARLSKLLKWFSSSWGRFGRLLLIKGPAWVEERKEAREEGLLRSLELRKLAEYPVVGADAPSVVLAIWPKGRAEPTGAPAGASKGPRRQ